MRLTIHRGAKEIGGSCVELAAGSTRIVLDLGMPLVTSNREPFDQETLRGQTTEQLQEQGILPNISGLFDDAAPPSAILLTHAHLDHSGLLKFSRPEIPVHTSQGTSKMMLAGSLFSRQVALPRTRFRRVESGVPFQIGDFRITAFSVDHSAFDSLAFLVEAEGRSLLYSGDLRLHGRKPGMAKKLIYEVAQRKIDVLLMEGTHLGGEKERGPTEYELEEQIIDQIKDAPGLVLATFSPQDVDRLVTFYRAARRTGRTFVADAYGAFILHLVSSQAKIPQPITEAGIRVYFNQSFEQRNLEKVRRKFLSDRISLDEIIAQPRKHVMIFRPSMVTLDFQGTLPPNCRCIYSYWKGYLTRPDWIELQEKIVEAGGDFIPSHASGHIYVADLVEFVTAIHPKTVIPIHTFEPRMFCQHFHNTCLLPDGQDFVIEP